MNSTNPAKATVVLFCRAGVAATGVVMAVDTAIQRLYAGISIKVFLERRQERVQVKEIVKEIRDCRASAILAERQYIFIYCCILEYIEV